MVPVNGGNDIPTMIDLSKGQQVLMHILALVSVDSYNTLFTLILTYVTLYSL